MASYYSNDLRRKLLEAHGRGEGSLSQLATRFAVSLGWAKKISAAYRATGKMERPPGARRGLASKITAEVEKDLRNWIGAQPDSTLCELQDRLWTQRQLAVSVGRLWTALREMGLRLKKSRYTPPSRTLRRVNTGAVSGGKKPARATRRG